MIENCNGSSDCRKSELSGGTMCPSYMATKDERFTTRARANLLREVLTDAKREEPFNSKEIFEILDGCLSCKACKSECPSNVDMAKLKSEFLYQYYKYHKISWAQKIQAYQPAIYKVGSKVPGLFNFLVTNKPISQLIKKMTGIAEPRKIPRLSRQTLRTWCSKNLDRLNLKTNKISPELYLFLDEFTNYLDTEIGIKAVLLLHKLGYRIHVIRHDVSGRTYISKGLLNKAKRIANSNVDKFRFLIDKDTPLVGIEPSAILSFRDEYPVLVDDSLKEFATIISQNTFTLEEFVVREFELGRITASCFTEQSRQIKFHTHCHQKSLSTSESVKKMLSIPANYQVVEISSGCCGMAGSFGYEKKHYDLSIRISELTLLPELRKTDLQTTDIVATGNSCRHQIDDGLHITSFHPVEILYKALK
jgi:Fe-S oxidoreductase